ncbi:MAG: alkaline phosphatase [Desulfuromonadales bacterium]|nr:MAG: alkaline phosphatase [Desulfuromonadales bacterium]
MRKTSQRFVTGIAAGTLLLASSQLAFAAGQAKNVILMISDGQGFNTLKATEYYKGGKAVYESFDVKYGMNTSSAGRRGNYTGQPYSPASMATSFVYAKSGATDSASAATAMFTGVKNYDNEVNYTTDNKALTTFFEKAAKAGKSIGAVSSVDWTHATPVSVFGHNIARGNYGQMAKEAIYGSNPNANNANYDAGNYNGNLKVVMAPGNPWYDNNAALRTTPNYGLIGEQKHWDDLVAGVNGWNLITTQAQFNAMMTGDTPDKVFGMPQAYDTLQYNRTGLGGLNSKKAPYADALNSGVPTLATMAKAALNVLDNNPNGFAVMIEGGAIDWANHADLTGRMIEEQTDFNDAVQAVVDYLDAGTNGNTWDNTLLIVTADHECGHLWGDGRVAGSTFFDVNGNGVFDHGVDYAHVKNNGTGNLPETWYHSTSHTNALVPLFAKGANSDLFANQVIGTEPNLKGIYNLDSNWDGKNTYIDNTGVFQVMNMAALATDISAQVSAATSSMAYNRVTRLYNGKLTITNTSAAPISGQLIVTLSNLSTGVTLTNASGMDNGAPFIKPAMSGDLAPGASITVPLTFSNPSNAKINFTTVTFKN